MIETRNTGKILVIAALALLIGLIQSGEARKARLKLATTTSVDNSGLLEYILPDFEKLAGLKVDVISVGTGKALKLAENGDVDVVLVHAPDAEAKFIAAGFGVNRRELMKNDFLFVGPPEDPAGIKKAGSLARTLKKLKSTKAVFISRGDDSGTHKKELKLWKLAGGKPTHKNYLETGQGMEATLRITFEKKGYTMTDRGSYLAIGKKIGLVPVFEGDPDLINRYSAIAVNPAKHEHVRYMDAMMFIAWLSSPKIQARIASFKVDGEILFHPTAVPQPEK